MRFVDWLNISALTLGDVAQRLGTSSETVRRYVTGARSPGFDAMKSIFGLTGGLVTPNDWVGVGHQPDAPSGDAGSASLPGGPDHPPSEVSREAAS